MLLLRPRLLLSRNSNQTPILNTPISDDSRSDALTVTYAIITASKQLWFRRRFDATASVPDFRIPSSCGRADYSDSS